jgi:hypothetical protein
MLSLINSASHVRWKFKKLLQAHTMALLQIVKFMNDLDTDEFKISGTTKIVKSPYAYLQASTMRKIRKFVLFNWNLRQGKKGNAV